MATNLSAFVSGHHALVNRTMGEGDFHYPKKDPPEARLPDWESLVAVVDGLFHVADVVPFAVIA